MEEYQKSRLGKTTFTSGFKQSGMEEYQSPRVDPYRSEVGFKSQESEEESLKGSRLSKSSR